VTRWEDQTPERRAPLLGLESRTGARVGTVRVPSV
jgi:hypothetical protein